MSRRNQARRRRSYTRRQHELRERRGDQGADSDWLARTDDWSGSDFAQGRGESDSGSFEGLGR